MTHILAEIEEALRAGDHATAVDRFFEICTAAAEADEELAKAAETKRVLWNAKLAGEQLFRKYRGQAPEGIPPQVKRPPAREPARESIAGTSIHAVPPPTEE